MKSMKSVSAHILGASLWVYLKLYSFALQFLQDTLTLQSVSASDLNLSIASEVTTDIVSLLLKADHMLIFEDGS